MIQQAIATLLDRRDLTEDEAHATMMQIMAGEATQAQIGGFLVALRMKGETIAEIAGCARFSAAMDEAEPLGQWDLVSLLIGVNDQYRGHGMEVFAQGFTNLLERAIALANHRTDRVFVLAIPDWSVTPFAQTCGHDLAVTASELDAFNAFAQRTCETRGIAFIGLGSPKPNFFGMGHLGDNLFSNCVLALDAQTARDWFVAHPRSLLESA